MIIAIDGPTASGKGTLSKRIAAHFGLPHLDTGLLYRAVGRQVMLNGGNPDNPDDALAAAAFPEDLLDDPALRDEATGNLASRASVHPQLRQALFERQRAFAMQDGGAVLDGRDIGTVIAPDANVKLFVIASAEVRARRRFDERASQGSPRPYDEFLADIMARDDRDANRAQAPLKMADDALLLDTTDLSLHAAISAAIAMVEQRR